MSTFKTQSCKLLTLTNYIQKAICEGCAFQIKMALWPTDFIVSYALLNFLLSNRLAPYKGQGGLARERPIKKQTNQLVSICICKVTHKKRGGKTIQIGIKGPKGELIFFYGTNKQKL